MPIVPATSENIARAGADLAAGRLVAFPTETVYGLGADATNGRAVASIYATKGRPSFNPLIIHVAETSKAWGFGVANPMAEALAQAFWPGPLTLVLPLRGGSGLSDLALAGLATVALRVPAHAVARALLTAAGRPLAAPSANRSGRISPTTAAHVDADFADAPLLILDGGETDVGLESTIVDVSGSAPVLLRPGGVTREALETVLGRRLAAPAARAAEAPSAPGQLASHYAPRALVRLDATTTRHGDALLAFGEPIAHSGPMRNLSPGGDLLEAAATLFSALHELDANGATTIAVMPIPTQGLGEAINDRLRRAAAPRL